MKNIKNMHLSIWSELQKSILNIGFVGAIVITFILCFATEVYNDPTNDKAYSVFEMIFSSDSEILLSQLSMSSIMVFEKALIGYGNMFLPIVASFPFVVCFCAERNSGYMRFSISRSGKIRYYISKFLSCILSGGLAVMFGVLLFGVAADLIFPGIESYSAMQDSISAFYPDGLTVAVVKKLISAMLHGIFATLPAFLICSFCRNPYMILCLPFLFTYMWETLINKFTLAGFEQGDFNVFNTIAPYSPYSAADLLYPLETERLIPTLIVNILLILIALTGFILFMNKRTDRGC